jgi:glycosyltransferase involved in cell wall biosynthesis
MSSIGLCIPAFNEELELANVYQTYKDALLERGLDHEIFIINDASTDKTKLVSEQIAAGDNSVTVIHHKKKLGLGYAYKEGMYLTTKEYYMFTIAAITCEKKDIHLALDYIYKKDMVLFHMKNPEIRPYFRQKIMVIYTFLVNFLTGLNLHYYNDLVLCRTQCLKALDLRLDSHGFSAEAVVQLIIHYECSYVELGYISRYRRGKSSGLRWDKIVDVGTLLTQLFWEKYFSSGTRFSPKKK